LDLVHVPGVALRFTPGYDRSPLRGCVWRRLRTNGNGLSPIAESLVMLNDYIRNITRRHFFFSGANILGAAALGSLLGSEARAAGGTKTGYGAALPETHFPAMANNIIYLHMVGGPSQLDVFDYKPKMQEYYDKDLPDSVRKGQRLTTMTSGQARFPIAPSKYKFAQVGKCGMWLSELLPNKARMADDMCFI